MKSRRSLVGGLLIVGLFLFVNTALASPIAITAVGTTSVRSSQASLRTSSFTIAPTIARSLIGLASTAAGAQSWADNGAAPARSFSWYPSGN